MNPETQLDPLQILYDARMRVEWPKSAPTLGDVPAWRILYRAAAYLESEGQPWQTNQSSTIQISRRLSGTRDSQRIQFPNLLARPKGGNLIL